MTTLAAHSSKIQAPGKVALLCRTLLCFRIATLVTLGTAEASAEPARQGLERPVGPCAECMSQLICTKIWQHLQAQLTPWRPSSSSSLAKLVLGSREIEGRVSNLGCKGQPGQFQRRQTRQQSPGYLRSQPHSYADPNGLTTMRSLAHSPEHAGHCLGFKGGSLITSPTLTCTSAGGRCCRLCLRNFLW